MGETSGGHLSPPTLKNISQKHVFGLEYAISGRRVVDVWGSSLKNISRKHLSKTSLKKHLSKTSLKKTSLKNISQKHLSKTSLKNISQKHLSKTSLSNISQKHLSTTSLHPEKTPPHIPSPIRGIPSSTFYALSRFPWPTAFRYLFRKENDFSASIQKLIIFWWSHELESGFERWPPNDSRFWPPIRPDPPDLPKIYALQEDIFGCFLDFSSMHAP